MVQSKLYKEAVETFGAKNQHIVTIGELAECSAEIAKMFISNREADEDKILNELADVVIMMEQMKVIYGDSLVQAVYKKLRKVKQHIENEKERQANE